MLCQEAGSTSSSRLLEYGFVVEKILYCLESIFKHRANMSLAVSLGETCNDQTVSIVTSDGKVLVGTLKGIDNGTNVILDDSHERVFSTERGVEKHQLGLCLIRGENVAVIGQVDRDVDLKLNLAGCKVKPLKPVVH